MAMVVGAALSAAEVAGWIQAIVIGGLLIGTGGFGLALARRNEAAFGVVLHIERTLLVAGLAGIAIATVVLAAMNDTTPSPRANGGAIGGAAAGALAGALYLTGRRTERWFGRVLLTLALTTVAAVVISPDSFVPRQLIFAGVLFGYAAWAWVRAGRHGA
jgi:hypothetical protein